MNTQPLLLSDEAKPQAHSLASPYDTNGNAKPVIHFRRSGRSAKCGLDLHYHAAIATSKVAETTCKNCLRIHQASVALRRKASAWQRDQQQKSNDPDSYGHPLRAHIECENDRTPQPVVRYPAKLKAGGIVAMEDAFLKAVEDVEMAAWERFRA